MKLSFSQRIPGGNLPSAPGSRQPNYLYLFPQKTTPLIRKTVHLEPSNHLRFGNVYLALRAVRSRSDH